MNARFRPSPASEADAAATLFDAGARQGTAPGPADRACCCVARAVVRVIMPPAPARPHETELLLCGHHYRASRRALLAVHARIEELPGSLRPETVWFHGDREHAQRAAPVGG